jgi:lipoprotein-anchoring transpeptidase ErfK/SrfK
MEQIPVIIDKKAKRKKRRELRQKKKKITIGIFAFVFILLLIYTGGTIYFMDRFYIGTTINSIDVSRMSVSQVDEVMGKELEKYNLTLMERDDKTEEIKISDIGLTYASGEGFKDSKDTQGFFKWFLSFINKEQYEIVEEIKFDENLLRERVDKLSCLDEDNIIEPQDAKIEYADDKYVIVPEVNGNKVVKDILYKRVFEKLEKGETSIDLESTGCYLEPEYTSDSEKIIEAKDLLNKYLSCKVTYTIGTQKEILDASIINQWIEVDSDMEVTIDEQAAKDYVETLAKEYNTVGNERDFVTSLGGNIKISGGDYGWSINKSTETQSLIENIKSGEVVERQPNFLQVAAYGSNEDIGSTYIEIDLTTQHLWYYKAGALITEGPIVTGNIAKDNGTPAGVYKLKYKQKDAVLKGEDYETNVAYWMPFNGNIGMHDATWRSTFGETIYMTNGSHGCVNCPYDLAESIYLNVSAGIPVICYN